MNPTTFNIKEAIHNLCNIKNNIDITDIKKISKFIENNRETLFFACSSLAVLLATTNPFLDLGVVSILGFSLLAASTVQGIAFLAGSKGFLGHKVHEKIIVLMGIGNVAAWLMDAHFGVAMVVFNTGINLSSFTFKHIFP